MHFRQAPDEPVALGRTVNISPGGLFVRTDEQLCAGQQVTVEVTFPCKRGLELRGRVAWTRTVPTHFRAELDNGFGLRIEQAPEQWFRLFLPKSH